jgi:hypothetical protein
MSRQKGRDTAEVCFVVDLLASAFSHVKVLPEVDGLNEPHATTS